MIELLTYGPSFGQPAASPFCVKAMMLLNMAGEDWTSEILTDPRKMPYEKLPVIRADGKLIADSDNIRIWLEARGADFDVGLNAQQRAQSRALIRMTEEHLYFHVVYDRWADDAVWPVTRDAYFGAIPRPIRGIITNGIRKPAVASLMQMGIGRFMPQERLARAELDLQAIRDTLNAPFLFGSKPTAADASIAPQLSGMMATPVPTLLGDRLRGDKKLVDYVQRVSEATL
ncbi:MAG: glutathione S-transferase [Yoonia sp.]|jgi:glutathione S-transferase